MNKILMHFAARNGQKATLLKTLEELAKELFSQLDEANATATLMAAHDDDSLRASGDARPLPVAFDASLEIKSASADADSVLQAGIKNLSGRLCALIHADLSAVQTGIDKVFVASGPTPIRFQYCMRRRADFKHAEYLQYYADIHSAFGVGTRGIEGYAQFHIDQDKSAMLAASAGFGVTQVDSVSELHIDSLPKFFDGIAQGIDLGDPGEDEDRFVDRARSVMWMSDEIYRLGF